MSRKLKILLLGASGLLGTRLSPFLTQKGFLVFTHALKREADFVFDLSNFIKTKAMISNVEPDFIVNLAALTNVDFCEEYPNHAYMTNVKAVENIVASIKIAAPRAHLIQISTDHVYDGSGPHIEEDVSLVNYYAFSKYAGELAAKDAGATILRTNFLCRSSVENRVSLCDWMIESVKRGGLITVFDDVVISAVHISSLCEGINAVICNPSLGVFNFGTQDNYSKADLARQLIDVLNLDSNLIVSRNIDMKKFKAIRPRNMSMDSSKFESVFKFCLPKSEAEIIKTAMEYANA